MAKGCWLPFHTVHIFHSDYFDYRGVFRAVHCTLLQDLFFSFRVPTNIDTWEKYPDHLVDSSKRLSMNEMTASWKPHLDPIMDFPTFQTRSYVTLGCRAQVSYRT